MLRKNLIVVTLVGLVMSLLSISAAPLGQLQTPLQTSIAGTAQALASKAVTAQALATKVATVNAAATKLSVTATAVNAVKTSPTEAADAITAYAKSVLSITVIVKQAGGLSGTITRTLSQTPNGSTAQGSVAKLAGKSYGAVLSNGAATLSYGSGTLSGNVTADVQGASLGVYSLLVPTAGTLTTDTALSLAKTTFPGLANLKYVPYKVTKGYAWYFKGNVNSIDPKTKKVVVVAEAVILYVLPANAGKASVSATVGRGEFATAVKAP